MPVEPAAHISPRDWLRRSAAGFADLVWPRVCIACGTPVAPTAPDACAACAAALAELVGEPYCHGCGDTRHSHLLIEGRCGACRTERTPFEAYVRVARYTGPMRTLILRFKREFTLDRYLGGLLGDAVLGAIDPARVACWTPIPSPFRRRISRGFQPTRLLAESVAHRLSGKSASLLRLTRYVPRFHHGMSATRRAEAIKGAFVVRNPARVRGRIIGVIDDVSTTGATLLEARRALRAAGATAVVAAVLAKT